jgi:hypothetical protein
MKTKPETPLALTSEQLSELVDIARALPVDHRSDHLQTLAERLRGRQFTCGDLRRAAIRAAQTVRES